MILNNISQAVIILTLGIASIFQGELLKPNHTVNTALPISIEAKESIRLAGTLEGVCLGAAKDFVLLSEAGITNVATSAVTGNVGTSPITGAALLLPCSQITGNVYVVDAAGPAPCAIISPLTLTTSIGDMRTAYTDAAGRPTPDFIDLGAGDISGRTLTAGLYKWGTSLDINTDIIISGSANDVFIFQIAGELTVASNVNVTLIGGANARNIYWVAAQTVVFGTGSHFEGSVLTKQNIAMQTGASINGRLYAQTAITLEMNTVTVVTNATPQITTTALADGKSGTPYSKIVEQIGYATTSWTATGLPTGLTMNTLTGEISGTPSVSGSFNINVTVFEGACSTLKSFSLVIADFIWDAGTWTPSVPTSTSNIHIRDNYNVATDGNLTANDFTLGNGATLTMPSGAIDVKGNVINNGTISQSGGIVTMNGSTAQTMQGTSTFANLTINNAAGVTLTGATNITGKLTLTSGTLTSGGNLTLKSNAAGTAYIVGGAGNISGNTAVEYHIKDNSGEIWGQGFNGTGYHYLSSPVNGLTVAGITNFTPEITDAAFYNTDWNRPMPNAFPNIFQYDESRISIGSIDFVKGWKVPTSTADVLASGTGFLLNLPTNSTVSFTGTVNDGDITTGVTLGTEAESGWALLGNPYPSPLNLKSFLEDGSNSGLVNGTAYVRIAASQYSGVWASFVASTGISSPTAVINNSIAPAQSFMVKAKGNGTITFKNSHRANNAFNSLRTKRSEGLIRIVVSADGKSDEMVVYFHKNATEGFDENYDAQKVQYNPAGFPTLLTMVEDKMLQIDALPLEALNSSVTELSLWAGYDGTHSMSFTEIADFAELGNETDFVLEDRSANTMTEIKQGVSYSFEAVKGLQDNRFFIHTRLKDVTGTEEEMIKAGIQLYSHSKTIEFKTQQANQQASISIFDLLGREMMHKEVTGNTSIETQLALGIYLVRIQTKAGVFSKRIRLQ